MSKFDINAIRNKLSKQRKSDPDEFKPGPELANYKFYILPPVEKGEMTKSGPAKQGMDNFFVMHGVHWFNKLPHDCPRVYNEQNNDCDCCQMGFDLMATTQNKDERRAYSRKWMPNEKYAINIYFSNSNVNPEELRGTVKYYKTPLTVLNIFKECINRDDAGADEDEPMAYGVFFDPENAHSFTLKVTENGEYTEYKTSKFSPKKEAIAATPEEIQKILDQRIDLFTKIGVPNSKAITDLVAKITGETSGDNDSGDSTGGFDQTEDVTEVSTKTQQNKPVSENKQADKRETKTAEKPTETKSQNLSESEIGHSTDDANIEEVERLLREMEPN